MSVHIRFGVYQFSARYPWILFTILGLALFLWLGFWQLDRAKEKKELQRQYEARLLQTPVSLEQLPKNVSLNYYPVRIEGQLDHDHSILLDNKIYHHRLGYYVVTPMKLNHGVVVLVNRGWILAPKDRQQLPVIPGDSNMVGKSDSHQITGLLYRMPGKPFTLGKSIEPQSGFPIRMQYLDMPSLERILGSPLYPWIVIQTSEDPAGADSSIELIHDWQPVNMPAHKHQGYAFQWFTFALVLIILFLGLTIKKI